jgi:5'-methylthioadenosine phosphorylase
VLLANADKARSLVKRVAPRLHADHRACSCACRHALDHALITAPDARDPGMVASLEAIAGRLLKSR